MGGAAARRLEMFWKDTRKQACGCFSKTSPRLASQAQPRVSPFVKFRVFRGSSLFRRAKSKDSQRVTANKEGKNQ
jgi:hypothetical protein